MIKQQRLLDKAFKGKAGTSFLFSLSFGLGHFLFLLALIILGIWLEFGFFLPQRSFLAVRKPAQAGMSVQNFTREEIKRLGTLKGVVAVHEFSRADFTVWAGLNLPGQKFGSIIFLESLPDAALDIPLSYNKDQDLIPVIIGENFLFLYNTAFAPAYGLPPLAASNLGIIGLDLEMSGGLGTLRRTAKILGTTARADTLLVPESFLQEMNVQLTGRLAAPNKVLLEFSPGAIEDLTRQLSTLHYITERQNSLPSIVLSFAFSVLGFLVFLAILLVVLSVTQILERLELVLFTKAQSIKALRIWGYSWFILERAITKSPWFALRIGTALAALLILPVYVLVYPYLSTLGLALALFLLLFLLVIPIIVNKLMLRRVSVELQKM